MALPPLTPKTISKGVLIFLNLCFLTVGIFLVVQGAKSPSANYHWTKVYASTNATSTTSTAAVIFGAIVVAIALVGIVGVATGKRVLLFVYAACAVLGLIAFVTIMTIAFISAAQAKDWKAKAFPADAINEPNVAVGFNQVYCYAQGGRFCVSGSSKSAIAMFMPKLNESTAVALFAVPGMAATMKKGMLGVCDAVEAATTFDNRTLPKSFKRACNMCKEMVTIYNDYGLIYDWADSACELQPATANWCGQYLQTLNQTEVYVNAPYKQCRGPILDQWRDWSNSVGIGAGLVAVAALVLVFLTYALIRKPKVVTKTTDDKKDDDVEEGDVGTPASADFEKAPPTTTAAAASTTTTTLEKTV
ncbi:Aste57867_9907 [Aphanomyces stellatus]|uniref:Aste57867_9907 protein n=1 Tax=Aphanomyces stellatus TaxID=120398 RepID=A0A485KP12_9STRA|nr:hypothetical protein As57867_009868 [Aphanomyces stellatus]VFT86786.1 Aste57867_9907 [Aphanomyces stellatus]